MKRQYIIPLLCEIIVDSDDPTNNMNTGSHIDQTIGGPDGNDGGSDYWEAMGKESGSFFEDENLE